MDYKDFLEDYEQSGLNQTAYGKKRNMSSSMVSYYLKKAREQKVSPSSKPIFTELKFTSKLEAKIIIKTINGTEIHVPL